MFFLLGFGGVTSRTFSFSDSLSPSLSCGSSTVAVVPDFDLCFACGGCTALVSPSLAPTPADGVPPSSVCCEASAVSGSV